MEKNCCITKGNDWFRYRAAGIVVEQGKVLFVQDDNLDYLYTVGGAVHMGEAAETAVLREMKEETGVDYEVDHLAVVCENFFDGRGGNIEGLNCHCLEFYFLMKSNGATVFNALSINADGNPEKMVWIPIEDIQNYTIKPSFIKERILDIINSDSILHIVTDADRNPKQ